MTSMIKLKASKLLMLACFTFFSALTAASEGELTLEVFVSEPNEINVTSPLIMGPTEMMVMSAQGTKSAAIRLADRIEEIKGDRTLKYIFLSHPHLDHSQGAGILLERFPEAQFIATPEVAALQRFRMVPDDELAMRRHKTNAAVPSVPVTTYTEDEILTDGHSIEIWKDIIGDAGVGQPDEPHVALHIPSLKAFMPSDVVYFNAHVMMGGSSKESRKIWRQQLQDWMKMDFEIVVPGHMLKTDLPNLTAQGALEHTYNYITAYEDVYADSETADELIDNMKALYPGMQHQSALYLGSFMNHQEMHRLMFNPTIESIANMLPTSFVKWVNGMAYRSTIQKFNPQPED